MSEEFEEPNFFGSCAECITCESENSEHVTCAVPMYAPACRVKFIPQVGLFCCDMSIKCEYFYSIRRI